MICQFKIHYAINFQFISKLNRRQLAGFLKELNREAPKDGEENISYGLFARLPASFRHESPVHAQQFGNGNKAIALILERRNDLRKSFNRFASIGAMSQVEPVVEENDIARMSVFDDLICYLKARKVVPIAAIVGPAYA